MPEESSRWASGGVRDSGRGSVQEHDYGFSGVLRWKRGARQPLQESYVITIVKPAPPSPEQPLVTTDAPSRTQTPPPSSHSGGD